METVQKLKTSSIYEDKCSYSRAVCAGGFIFVSNTAGRNKETKIISEDIKEQTEEVFVNIEAALSALDSNLSEVVFSRVFIQNPEDIEAVMEVIAEKFRGIDPATTITCPPLGSTVYKVEIELTAFRGASTSLKKRIN